MDGTGPHHIKQNEPESEAPITYFLSNVNRKKKMRRDITREGTEQGEEREDKCGY